MYVISNPLYDASLILCESENPTMKEQTKVQMVLEDSTSPVQHKYMEKLYDSIINKQHIDFDNIPMSKGNIVEYSGYTTMIEVLENIQALASSEKADNVIDYVNIVKDSIAYMRKLAPLYQKGFKMRSEYVMLEYNCFVYTIVQATSALLYEFVDYMKKPLNQTMSIVLRNTKYHANDFFFSQLNKFNKINKSMEYPKYLESMIQNGRENFTGAEVIGFAAVAAILLAIVPVTRKLVYVYYNTKSKISDCLAQQAYFLEMNKTIVEANSDFNDKKKAEILLKQEKMKNLCNRLSEKLRVEHVKSINSSKAALQNDNKLLTLDNITKETNSSPLQLL